MVSRGGAPRNAPRGPAAKRHASSRSDRDGDVAMDIAVKGRAGRIGKATASTGSTSRSSTPRGAKAGILSASTQRAILRQAGGGDISMKEARVVPTKGGLVDLKVTGWKNSRASTDADGGVSSLVKWLEKKASTRLGSRVRNVRIKKSHLEGSELRISVAAEDVGAILRMNGYGWAGINVIIERLGGPSDKASAPSSEAEKTKAMLRGVLERRYKFDTKLLDLSALGQDEELQAQNIFDSKSTAAKFFPAMMVVLESSFDTPSEKDAAILSVSLANNELVSLEVVTTLSETLPKLQNLDLSGNKFEGLSALSRWRRRFYSLQHLVLSNNPIEQTEPGYAAEIVNWYPNLRMLNNIQVRTEEEVSKKAKVTNLPFPVRSALFMDEGGIAENFVRTFFAGFDTDRRTLAAYYYDDMSEFSYAVNTQAPRDPNATSQTEKQEWEHYIKNSRNLKKISQLPARQNRLFRGTQAIADVFIALPKTRHPDLASDARKWMIEAHIQPGVPDATNQSPTGVDGFMITIHGEFDEVDEANGQVKKKRSFDRTFMLGPGGPNSVRVVCDMLTVRAYGGAQAFEPDAEGWNVESTNAQQVPAVAALPQLPAGLNVEVAEQMVLQLQKQTGMTVQYAKECLEQMAWSYDEALAAFAKVKDSLPPAAFERAV